MKLKHKMNISASSAYYTIDITELEILARSGDGDERLWASRVKALRLEGSMLLCTILFANVWVNCVLQYMLAVFLAGFSVS